MRITSPETLARLLADRLAERGDPGRAITLAQLLEDVLSYPGVRSELGLAGKGEYDMAMLGLLTHRSLLQVDPAVAAAARRELESPEPGLGFSDDFAEHLLRLRPGRIPSPSAAALADPEPPETTDEVEVAPPEPLESAAEDVGPIEDEAPTADEAPPAHESPPADDAPSMVEPPPVDAAIDADPDLAIEIDPAAEPVPVIDEARTVTCGACAGDLPERAGLRYCPHCGADQTAIRCNACGELLERGWRFCPRCGRGLDA